LEWVLAGEKLQRCRTAFLSQVRNANEVLVLGEGNGRFLLECRKLLGSARIICVDASLQMLELARQRLGRADVNLEGIEFVHADVLTWAPPKRAFDLIITHFFLDCFKAEQLEPLLTALARASCPGAAWLIADFQIPNKGIGRWRAQVIHRIMYAFFRLATRLPARQLTAPDPFLTSRGFYLRDRLVSDWGLLRSDIWQRVL
jgi:ubiquinone/menaquinone biosynthesis C-methylase UbiE